MLFWFSAKADSNILKMKLIERVLKIYLFYNGNNYGYDGFGYAELLEE